MKYTLYLINKNPVLNTIATFTIAKDVIDFKKKAIQQGFQVKVKGEKNEPENLFGRVERAIR